MYSKQSSEMGKSKKKGSKMKDLAKKYTPKSGGFDLGAKKPVNNAVFSGKQILD